MCTIKIELSVDFDDDTKLPILHELARIAARQLYTATLLIADKRKPRIAVHSEDFFEGVEAISLDDGIPANDPPSRGHSRCPGT